MGLVVGACCIAFHQYRYPVSMIYAWLSVLDLHRGIISIVKGPVS
jgi:hypothetical protein